MQSGRPLVIISRGRRGRGPGDTRGQQDPRHLQLDRRQGPRLSVIAARPCCRTWPSSPAARSSAKRSASSSRASVSNDARQARKVVVTKDETTHHRRLPASRPTSNGRIDQIKAEIENTDSDYDRREAPGAPRQAEPVAWPCSRSAPPPRSSSRKRSTASKMRVSTTKAAIEEGVVAGGGVDADPGPSRGDQAAIDGIEDRRRKATGAQDRRQGARGSPAPRSRSTRAWRVA